MKEMKLTTACAVQYAQNHEKLAVCVNVCVRAFKLNQSICMYICCRNQLRVYVTSELKDFLLC